MNTHEKISEMLTGFALQELTDEQSDEVKQHLDQCQRCKEELKRLETVLGCAESMSQFSADSQSCELAKEAVFKKLGNEEKIIQIPRPYNRLEIIWRTIMRSPITKLAAAAAVIVVALVGIHLLGGGTVTFADVIEPILNARTIVLDLVVGSEETGLVVHDIIVGSKIRRTLPNMGLAIIDLDNARLLRLDPLDKSAVYIDIQGPLQKGFNNYLGIVRDIVADMENHPEWPVQELGQRRIDGQSAVGFLLSGPKIKLTIWADAETATPIRIEMLMGRSQTIIKNIEFDIPVDESLVSMDIPDGYTLYEKELDYTDFDEQDFIIVLQHWAEQVLSGNFPDSVSAEDILKVAPVLRQKIVQLNISDEEKMQIGMAMGRGFMFFRHLDPKGIDWHYVGKGVELGDANTAVFLYRPKDSDTYRVIYGDLHVEVSAPEDLPK